MANPVKEPHVPSNTTEAPGVDERPGAAQPRQVVARRAWGPWAAAVVAVLLTFGFVSAVITNPNLDMGVIGTFLFHEAVLRGVVVTIQLSILSMVIGTILGLIVALARLSTNSILSSLALGYVGLLRGIPALIQLLLWGNIALLFSRLTLTIPVVGWTLVDADTNALVSVFTAAVIGLALHESAYMAEVIRSGILAVDRGQLEAASALGMAPSRIMRRVVVPQAVRIIIPPTANQFMTLIKGTSLVAVIAGGDLLTETQSIAANNYRVIEMLIVAALWYLLIVGIANLGQMALERRFSRGVL